MEVSHTNRGFALSKFADHYGTECSLQDSSIMDPVCVWFGTNVSEMQIMASEFAQVVEEFKRDLDRLALANVTNDTGWVQVALPKKACVMDRMHLTQDMVESVLPNLAAFVETGTIEGNVSSEKVYKCAKCGHVYQGKVDRCDCLDDGEEQKWLIGTAYFSEEE